jgi:hypothetical protein
MQIVPNVSVSMLAAQTLAVRQADIAQNQQETHRLDATRARDTQADKAAGVGGTQEEAATDDRDADGRELGNLSQHTGQEETTTAAAEETNSDSNTHLPDPFGLSGTLLNVDA